MEPFRTVESPLIALHRPNIDTDQLTPARFLKKSLPPGGYGEILLHDWRFDADGSVRDDSPIDDPARRGATVLVAGDNFGCGSSRETAVWALTEAGFRAVISTSFGDIFHTNSLKNGLLPIRVDEATLERLFAVAEDPDARVTIDLEATALTLPDGERIDFPVDPFARECLLRGLDQMGYLLEMDGEIGEYEKGHPLPEITLPEPP
jgi:3-isopropylmalate/(R)-2-methylmalate dehydratase small subunit